MFRLLGAGVGLFVMDVAGRHYLEQAHPVRHLVVYALVIGAAFVGAALGALIDMAGGRK